MAFAVDKMLTEHSLHWPFAPEANGGGSSDWARYVLGDICSVHQSRVEGLNTGSNNKHGERGVWLKTRSDVVFRVQAEGR